jgi:integrase
MPEGDRHAMVVNANGFPVDWPNLYCSISLRPSGIGLSMMQTRMNAVCMLHNWCNARNLSLQERIESFDLFTMEEINALRFEMRINRSPSGNGRQTKVVGNPHWRMRLKAIADYVYWHADHVIGRMSARDPRKPGARKHLDQLCKQIVGKIRRRKGPQKEGLEPEVQEIFARAITPGHSSNVFARRIQNRNYAVLSVYSEGGLRRGEGVGLKCIDMHLNGPRPYITVERRPDDPDDSRAQEARTKTLAHPVDISPAAAKILADYMIYDRPTYRDAKKLPYVFLSQEAKPLSLSSVDRMFRKLREVPGIPEDFTSNSLRRTWNDRVGDAAEEIGIAPDLEMQLRNHAQGRVRHSNQAISYQRGRLRRLGNKIALKMQDKTKDRPNG